VQKLAQHIENQDPTVSLKALDTSFKLDGYQTNSNAQEITLKVVDLSSFKTDYKEKIIDVTPDVDRPSQCLTYSQTPA
jgi:hypothetical protein